MRLINVTTLQLEEFFGEAGNGIPPYAILSHTWGDDEVSFKDFESGRAHTRNGYAKITGCCALAADEGFGHAWIDTCCIDKSSSAELSEAINSMFKWYRDSELCFAYLSDVDSAGDPSSEGSAFVKSRWFTRGWTLQELLAPAEVVFVGRDWREIGTKATLRTEIAKASGIADTVLGDRNWDSYSVAQKISWAAERRTTREEDEAYCLLGIFDVNMPLLYGEGRKAFVRLQEEIMRRHDDQSIFAWSYPDEQQSHVQTTGLLAPSPRYFKGSSEVSIVAGEAATVTRYIQKADDQAEEYINPFEVIRQLVRIRLPVLGPLSGICVRSPIRGSLGTVVEVARQGDDFKKLEQQSASPKPKKTESSTPLNFAVPSHWTPIEGQPDAFADDLSKALDKLAIEHNTVTKWSWYIYEPIVVIPLMCTTEDHHLGILLTRSMFDARKEGILYRLHCPSLICLDDAVLQQLSPIRTCYVFTSYLHNRAMGPAAKDARHEVRVSQLVAKGYSVLPEPRSGWLYDAKRARLTKMEKWDDADNQDRTALVAFVPATTQASHAQAGGREASPSLRPFLLQVGFQFPVIGFFDLPFAQLGNMWSVDLTKASHGLIPTRAGHTVTVRKREPTTGRYLSISIEDTSVAELRGFETSTNVTPTVERRGLRLQLQATLSTARPSAKSDGPLLVGSLITGVDLWSDGDARVE